MLVWILALTLYPAASLFAQQRYSEGDSDARWEVLEGCRLVTNSVVDGDSFRVLHKEREYIFRLYFVDTPESDGALGERAKDQATYFGIASSDITAAARLASQFTRQTLSGGEFTVVTRWQNAMGRSSLARFYAVVFVNGKNLAEELVSRGLARIYGLRANWPDGPRSVRFINQLKNFELAAREQKRGVWDESRFPRVASGSTDVPGPKDGYSDASPLDVNTASFEDLQQLPGIGPKLAERIIAHRPYKRLEDLNRVPGIGLKTIDRLKPLLDTESPPP